MSTKTCTLSMDSQLESFLSTSLFDNKPLESYLDSDLDTILNTSLNNASSTSPDNPFDYNLFNYNQPQNANNVSLSVPGAFGTSHIDPSLVVPLPGILNGGMSSTCPPTSISLPQNSAFTTQEPSNAKASSIEPAVNPQISEGQNTNVVKKRRSRKKKAPLPPAVKEEKRRVFLAKNRIAASKCREKNRQKWERIQEQCVELEAENKVLKERWREMKDEMEGLKKLVAEHRKCGGREMDRWIEEQNTNKAGLELDLERGNWNSSTETGGWSGSTRAHSVQDDSEIIRSRETREAAVALNMATTLGTQSRSSSSQVSRSSDIPTTQGDSFSGSIDDDIDITSFINDEVPALSPPSRKTSAASSDFEMTSTARQFSSPTDSAVDLTTDIEMGNRKVGMEQAGVTIMGQDGQVMPDTSIFSMCEFTSQQTLPGTGAAIW